MTNELHRLLYGVIPDEKPSKGKFLVDFNVKCNGNSTDVLSKCKEVLKIVLEQKSSCFPSFEEWKVLLPQ